MISDLDSEPPSDSPPATAPPHGENDTRPETFGPVALTRHVKDDGRALILYERLPADGSEPESRGDRQA